MISFPVFSDNLNEYGGARGLSDACRALGCDGIEAVWGGDNAIDTLPDGFAHGYHLLFYPDWVDFWRGNEEELIRKFGSREAYRAFYGGEGKETLLSQYRLDLARAESLGARYVVFHVSDVSLEEGVTYRWLHDTKTVLDAALELINLLFSERSYPFALLVENQWWPGPTFTDPEETRYLLGGIKSENKGIMLDTGHLMNANTELKTEAEGARYIERMLTEHGALCSFIRGVHLHKSLSGEYVKTHTGGEYREDADADYLTRYGENYAHILKIDRHEPWTDPCVAELVRRIAPEWLTHELSCKGKAEREERVALQRDTLRRGGL